MTQEDRQPPPKTRRASATDAPHIANPATTRDANDPGDETQRNFRYQHAYGVMLLVSGKRGIRPYVAVWCEHHDDFLAERVDGRFDAYQIKTSRPERGPWKLADEELVKSIGRFVDLVEEFQDSVGSLFFVSNKECDDVSADSRHDKRRGRCPKLFLQHLRACPSHTHISHPFDATFSELQAECGCAADVLFRVLRSMEIVLGPSRGEFDAALSHEHLAQLPDCRSLPAADLDRFRDDLVATVYRASSLQVTDSIRHLRSVLDGSNGDPILAAKRLQVSATIVYRQTTAAPSFQFTGEPVLALGTARPASILEQKLESGGLTDEIEYLRARERAAEFNLLEDISRQPERYPALLRQVEEMVLGECSEAHLRARQAPAPYGPAMLIDVQDRLRRLSAERGDMVGGHSYECLVGVAGLLTSECRVWWSARFPVASETN